MSVVKSKRSESSVDFLQTARELEIYTIKKVSKFPKTYTFYISQPLAQCDQISGARTNSQQFDKSQKDLPQCSCLYK